jgi:hypothetical protein
VAAQSASQLQSSGFHSDPCCIQDDFLVEQQHQDTILLLCLVLHLRQLFVKEENDNIYQNNDICFVLTGFFKKNEISVLEVWFDVAVANVCHP